MKHFRIGRDYRTGKLVYIPLRALPTHFHLIGGTGKGKTTALHTILQQLMLNPFDESCFLLIDRIGNFSQELLQWMASDFCTDDVRNRLVYIEPAREDRILSFNPLLYDSDAHGYFKVSRATDIILRAWEDVNIEAMPRLARWTFNAFWAAAQLRLTIADCVHLLMPGSPYHRRLLECLPPRLKYEWEELLRTHSGEVTRILDSSRNRLKPYFESDILRRMFGSTENRLDVHRFMREGKIVLINLAPGNRLSGQLANAIGALILNEVLATARSLPRGVRFPTYVVLDEFQNFIGPDIESALPEVRQLGLRLFLSHQSFSQLERGNYDMTSMIFQAQSRLIFGVQGEDADLLAHELASIQFDAKRIKEELYSRRQLVTGHSLISLRSSSDARAHAEQWRRDYGTNWSNSESTARQLTPGSHPTFTRGQVSGASSRSGEGGGDTSTHTEGSHEQLVPEYDQFLELMSRTFYTFEEQKNLWAKAVRNLSRGQAILRLVDDPHLYEIDVERSAPGHLAWDVETIAREYPEALDDVDRLVEKNFASEIFSAPERIDAEADERMRAITGSHISIQRTLPSPDAPPSSGATPFR